MPPPPKKPAPLPTRRPTSDGFEIAAKPPSIFAAHTASLDYGKAIAGLTRRLLEQGELPKEIPDELLRASRTPHVGPRWEALVRLVLSPPAPEDDEAVARESRQFAVSLDGPLSRIAVSWHLRCLRTTTVELSFLLRGADVVVEEAADLLGEWMRARPRAITANAPFPGAHAVDLPDLGTLLFARGEGDALIVRLEAPLVPLRALVPKTLRFFEERFVKGQNVGPMGCSPRTLRSGSPARAAAKAPSW